MHSQDMLTIPHTKVQSRSADRQLVAFFFLDFNNGVKKSNDKQQKV